MNRKSLIVWANVVNLRREYSVFLKTSADNETSKCVQQNSSVGDTRIRGYDEMPGPKAIPLIGNSWRFLPVIGGFFIFLELKFVWVKPVGAMTPDL